MGKHKPHVLKGLLIGVLIAISLISCKHNSEHEYHNIMEKIKAESELYTAPNISSEKFNGDIKTVPVREDGFDFLGQYLRKYGTI